MSKTTPLIITDEHARSWHKKGTPEEKEMLEQSFIHRPGFFSTNVMDRVKSFLDVLAENGETVEQFNERTKGLSIDAVGNEEYKSWAKALNEGWESDYRDRNQRKHYPIFDTVADSSKHAGVGLSLHGVFYVRHYVVVGSLHHFKSEELVKHAVKYGMSSFEKHLLGN